MRYVKKLDREALDGNLVLVFDDVQLRLFNDSMLLEFVFHERHGEAGPVHGYIQMRENEWKRSDVVFVSVCKKDRFDCVLVFEQVCDIVDDDVAGDELFVWTNHAGIDQYDRSVVPERY